MKKNLTLLKKLLLLFSFSFVFMLICKGQTTIVSFNLISNNNYSGGISGNSGCTFITNQSSGTALSISSYSSNGAASKSWASGNGIKWWETHFSTIGYANVFVQSYQSSDATGPRDFKVQYKIGSGGTWTDGIAANNIAALSSNIASASVRLPAACDNQSVVYVRWLMKSNTSVNNGTVSSSAYSYIKNVSIFGLDQAYGLTFQSRNGNEIIASWNNNFPGTKCVVKINSVNSFTSPTDGTNPTANTSYTFGSGEQVVYNNEGTNVSVTVTDLTKAYWFQVYNYSYYTFTSPASYIYLPLNGSANPAMASFPTVVNPSYANISTTSVYETSVDLGGEITSDGGSTIAEKGIYYNYNGDVSSLNGSKIDDYSGSSPWIGAFSSAQTVAPKSKVYFRAFAYNGVGTALSEESSFFTKGILPSQQVANFQSTEVNCNSITLQWDGISFIDESADGYLILMKAGSTAPSETPTDGVQYVEGSTIGSSTVVANVLDDLSATLSATISNLPVASQYSFTIIPYSGNTDYNETFVYQTSETIPHVTTSTQTPTITATHETICLGASTTLSVTNGTSYNWASNPGTWTSSDQENVVTPSETTTYTVTISEISGCTASKVITVSTPTANAGNKKITCPGVSLTLNATGGNTYSWSSGSTSASATVTPTVTSTYTVTATNAYSCSATSSVVVVVATTLYSDNTGGWDVDNNWDVTVTPAPCNDVIISYGHTVNLSNLAGSCNNLTVLGTLNIDGTSSLTCSGKITNGSTGIINIAGAFSGTSYDFTTPGNTISYNNSASNQSVIPVKYYHLSIQNSGHTATMTSNDTVNGNLIISGALQSTSQNLIVNGDFTNNGTFTHNNGKVIFNGNTNYNGSSVTTFNKVDIAAGKLLTIAGGGKTMRVSNVIRLLASGPHNMGQLAILDNASQLTGTGSNDSVYVQVYDTLDNWHYISAPIDSNYMGAMCYKYFYGKLYTETKGLYEWYDGKLPLYAGRGFAIKWNATYIDPKTNKLVVPADRLVTIPAKISKLHTGTITYPVTNTTNMGGGWNLVGNPYPCAIDWKASNGWNNTSVDPTVYIYDAVGKTYLYCNKNLSDGMNTAPRYIPSMQGFYVHCSANGSWSMDNRVRVAYNQPFWKGAAVSASDANNQVRLLINGNNYSDEALIAFNNEATNGFDDMLDAYKLFSPEENVPQINTKTLDINSTKVALNNLPVSKMYNSKIPVEITTGVAGKYTITANNLTIDPTIDVTLEDLKTKTFTDLRSSSYTFTTVAVSNENRFNVLFGVRPTSIKEINTENISIYADHSQIVIKNYSGSTEKSLVTVYDILGKQITERNLEPNSTSTIDMNQSNAQSIYFVKVTTENKSITKKIFIIR